MLHKISVIGVHTMVTKNFILCIGTKLGLENFSMLSIWIRDPVVPGLMGAEVIAVLTVSVREKISLQPS